VWKGGAGGGGWAGRKGGGGGIKGGERRVGGKKRGLEPLRRHQDPKCVRKCGLAMETREGWRVQRDKEDNGVGGSAERKPKMGRRCWGPNINV